MGEVLPPILSVVSSGTLHPLRNRLSRLQQAMSSTYLRQMVAFYLLSMSVIYVIDLELLERLHDPVLERMDLILRIGDLADNTLIATRFDSQRSVFAASPECITRHGVPQTPTQCVPHGRVACFRPMISKCR
jgi:hypothetical protein